MSSFKDLVRKVNEEKKTDPANQQGQSTKDEEEKERNSSFKDLVRMVNDGTITVGSNLNSTEVNDWYSRVSDVGSRASEYLTRDGYRSPDANLMDEIGRYLDQASDVGQYIRANRSGFDNYDEAIQNYHDVVGYLRDLQSGIKSYNNYFSQWDSEDAYNKWLQYSTPEGRQEQYEKNKTRLEELLEEQKRERVESSTYKPGMNAYTFGGGMSASSPYAAGQQAQQASDGKPYNNPEIAQLQKEVNLYERGEADEDGFYYGFKVADDYGKLRSNEDFAAQSANRNFQNSSIEDLINANRAVDSSTWYVDADGVYRDVYGDELVVDENGNWASRNAQGYGITDRLGMYLNASEEDRALAFATDYSGEGTWSTVINDGYYGNWELLTEGEIDIYYYLLNTSGKEAAYKYLSDMTVELNRRGTYNAIAEYAKKFDEAGTLERIAMSIATTPAQLFYGATGFLEDTANVLAGNDINPYSSAHWGTHFSDTIRGEQAKALDEATGGIAIPFINFSAGDLYQAGMSAFDMAVGGKLGAGAYAALMGMRSASSEAQRLYSQGASTEQIAWGSALAGGAEMVFERASIEHLIKLKDAKTLGQFVKNALIQGGIEASEEGFTEIANTITNAIVMGDESDWAKLLEEHDGDYLAALITKTQEVGNVAFSGFVSGGIGGVTHSAVPFVRNQVQQRRTGKTIMSADGGVDALKQLANDVAGVSSEDMQQNITKQTARVDRKATAGRVGRLYDTVNTANNLVNASANKADIAKSLERKGFNSETANDIAEALVASYNGQELTNAQKKLLKSAQNNTVVQDAIANIMNNTKSTMGQRSDNIRNFQRDIAIGSAAKAISIRADEARKMPEGNLTTAEENTPESHYEVSADGKTIDSDGNIVTIKGVSSIENGHLVLETENGTMDAGDLRYASESEAFVYEAVANLEGMIDTNTANKLSKHLLKLGGVSSDVYIKGITQAYTYGYYGYGRDAMTGKDALSATLSEAQRNVAYGLGEQYRNAKTAADQAKAGNATVVKKSAVTGKENTTSPDGTVYKKVRFESDIKKWGKKQQREVAYIDFIASNFSGNTVHVFESFKDSNGKYVYEDLNGQIHAAPNGMYSTSTGDIYLDLNAGNHGEGLIMNTFCHELYHHIEKRSPVKARELAEFLVKELGYRNVEYAVNRQIKKAERAGHGVESFMREDGLSRSAAENLVYDRAFSDFVADSLETMFTEGDAIGKLKKLKGQNESLFYMIKRFVKTWVKKLHEFYRNRNTISTEGDMVANLEKFDQIQQMFVEALVDAGDNFQSAEVQKNTTDDGGVRYQERESQHSYSKSFADQLTDYQNGNIRADDALVVGGTPSVLKKIGLAGLPMTINQKHIGDALNGTYKGTPQEIADHTFTVPELSTLPEKIADPIAVIYDKRTGKANASESNIDVLVEMTVASGKQVLAAIQVNGNGRINGIRIDANKVATVHGNTDSTSRLVDAINENAKGNVAVFYINNNKTTKALQRTGNPIPSGLSNLDGFIHSITDPGSPVKMRISSATESQQFKRWFGDWENHPENASKVLNADGTPKVMYHGSPAQFTIFDKKKAKSSGLYGKGFYFTDSASHASTYGNQYAVYLNIRNPLEYGRSTVSRQQVRKFLEEVAGNEDYSIENYGTYDVDEILNNIMGSKRSLDAFQLLQDVNATAIGDLVEAAELFNKVNGTEFDGIVLPTETVAFRPEQIKSATDNIGTFDTTNPDIRYSDRDYMDAVNHGDMETAQRMVDEAAKKAGYTAKVYHGTQQFGFTKPNVKKSDDGISFFATDDIVVAGSYSGTVVAESRKINEKKQQLTKRAVPKLRNQVKVIALEFLHEYTTTLGYYDSWYMDSVEYITNRDTSDVVSPGELMEYATSAIDTISAAHWNTMSGKSHGKQNASRTISEETKQKLADLTEEYARKLSAVISPYYNSGVYGLYANTDNHLVIDAHGSQWNDIKSDDLPSRDGAWKTRDVAQYAKENGYSGVTFKNIVDPANYTATKPATVYAFLEPQSQLRSADPVTYDKFGRVIPLEKRFDSNKNDFRYSDRDDRTYAEIETERQALGQREMALAERKRKAVNDPELLKAMDDASGLFTEVRGLFAKKRNGTATQAELDRIEEIKRLREESIKRVEDLQKSLGLNAIAQEESEIRETKEALRIAADAAWAREGAAKENKAIEKAGVSAPEYFRKKALKAFKTTTNFNEAGYLLPDGKLLNFSGGERNHRYRDHREIGEIYEATQGAAALNRFMSDGNIRIMAESPGVDITSGVEPTKEQYAALRKFVNANGVKDGRFFVDFSDTEGHRAGNYSYEGRVNADRVINDIKHYYATGEIREQSSVAQFRWSDRDTESVSNRSLLANAFEGVAQNDIERNKIQEYKGKIDLINAEERKLAELNQKIKDLSFSKGPKDTKAIRELQFEANQTANRISTYDKQLLRLEASKPLQAVLAREKQMAYKRAEQKGKEALTAYREKAAKTQRELLNKWQESRKKGIEGREKTAMRHKIRKTIRELNKLFAHGNKERNVKDGMTDLVATALASAEILFTDTYTDNDLIRNGVSVPLKEAESKLLNQAMDILAQLDNTPAAIDVERMSEWYKNEEQLKHRLAEIKRNLRDVLERERIRLDGATAASVMDSLCSAYESLKNSEDSYIAESFDESVYNHLVTIREGFGTTRVYDMRMEQLEALSDAYTMVLTTVRNANKTFTKEKKETISNLASIVVGEVRIVGGEHKYRAAILDSVRKFGWNNLKPVYAFEHIGSDTLRDAFNSVRKGEDTWAKDVTEARKYYLDKSKKYGYDSWDFKKKYSFESNDGTAFELTLEQILSLYAYSKREQAHDHLRLGGFVFDTNIETYKETVKEKDGKVKRKRSILKYKVNTADAHQITPEILADITGTLTKEQMAFVDEMQDYLSTVMGAKGNEVTMQMYGVKLFKEKFYFPLKSAKQFMFEQNEVSGEVKIKNAGFTNKTVAKANNPVILRNFMDVWAGHVNDMSMYHSFVLPLEDFNRIFNYNSPKKEGQSPVSVKGTIQSAYTPAAVDYVKQLITDLNGGAVSDPRETTAKAMMSKFKKAKVMASLSVIIQQPSSIARAFALVNPKYFRPTKDGMNHEKLWDELKQYAPVAIIKEMGYFDTNMGKSTQDFIMGKEYSGFKEKMKALVTDSSYRDEALSKLPALADELTWCAIWNAVKRETVSTHKDLRPGSEEFLKAAGERFAEVVTKTQVYDSVLARSANMRSKTGLMSMATSFMAEPTTAINMLEDAIRKGKRGNKGYAARAFASVATAIVLNNALVSIVYAMRDDDEDETFLEKYAESFVSGMLDDSNPLTYYPFLKDVWSLLQGYDVERSDMSLISDLSDAMKKLVTEYTKEDGDIASAWLNLAGTAANIGGVPVQNLLREVDAVSNFYNTLKQDVNGRETTLGSMMDALQETVRSTLPVIGWLPGETKADKLYDAIISGDTAYVNRLKSGYTDESALNTAIRKALRENDPRIEEAAAARFAGDFVKYSEIFREIQSEGNFDFDTIMSAVNSEVNALEKAANGEETAKTTEDEYETVFDASMYYTAVVNGDQASAKLIYDDLIEEKIAEGYLRHEAEDSIASSFATQVKDDYMDGEISRSRAVTLLENNTSKGESEVRKWDFELENGFSWSERVRAYRLGKISEGKLISAVMYIEGEDRDSAEEYIRFLDLEMDNGDIDIKASDASSYFEYAEPAGIDIGLYLDYKDRASLCESDKDENGRTISGSKKAKVLDVIDSLPITSAQKDALYFAEGWAESELHKAPWH